MLPSVASTCYQLEVDLVLLCATTSLEYELGSTTDLSRLLYMLVGDKVEDEDMKDTRLSLPTSTLYHPRFTALLTLMLYVETLVQTWLTPRHNYCWV